jgi:hypothetical protein
VLAAFDKPAEVEDLNQKAGKRLGDRPGGVP